MTDLFGIGLEIWSFIFSMVAIVIAIAKELIIPIFIKPDIVVEYSNDEGFIQDALVISNMGTPHYDEMITGYNRWLRLKVFNKGRTTAKGVYVKLIAILDGNGSHIQPFDPSPLRWTVFHDHKIDLAKGEHHFVDLAKQDDGTNYFIPQTMSLPNGLSAYADEKLSSGKYKLDITVYGDNIEPVSKQINIIVSKDFKELKFDL